MSHPASSLFRQEVLAAQADTSWGPALHIRPVSAAWLSGLLALVCVLVLLLLSLGSYTKRERVRGVVQARDGVSWVVPPEAGIITRVRVREGDVVKAGAVIAELNNERYSDEGGTQGLIETNLRAQGDQLTHQVQGQDQASLAALQALDQRMEQDRKDLGSLDEEIELQNRQIASARQTLARLEPLGIDHIVSELQVEQQRQVVLEQSAHLQALQRQRNGVEAAWAQGRAERDKVVAQQRITRAGLDRDLLGLQQEAVQRHGARIALLKAAADGVVSGLTVTPGQHVSVNGPIASIVPLHSPMQAALFVPSTAVGFIRPGQHVRLSYDAFPYQRFGQYGGTVMSVSQTDVPMPDGGNEGGSVGGSGGDNEGGADRRAVFLVRVALDAACVHAYGRDIALHPGHTLSADVEIDRRRLIRWMLDPLMAFSGTL